MERRCEKDRGPLLEACVWPKGHFQRTREHAHFMQFFFGFFAWAPLGRAQTLTTILQPSLVGHLTREGTSIYYAAGGEKRGRGAATGRGTTGGALQGGGLQGRGTSWTRGRGGYGTRIPPAGERRAGHAAPLRHAAPGMLRLYILRRLYGSWVVNLVQQQLADGASP